VIDLLQDESLSYREIARRAGCSDFSVRAIAREADAYRLSDSAAADELLTPRDWWIVAGIAVTFFGGLWFLGQQLPPPNGEAM
jgi:hypothetical protein